MELRHTGGPRGSRGVSATREARIAWGVSAPGVAASRRGHPSLVDPLSADLTPVPGRETLASESTQAAEPSLVGGVLSADPPEGPTRPGGQAELTPPRRRSKMQVWTIALIASLDRLDRQPRSCAGEEAPRGSASPTNLISSGQPSRTAKPTLCSQKSAQRRRVKGLRPAGGQRAGRPRARGRPRWRGLQRRRPVDPDCLAPRAPGRRSRRRWPGRS